MHAVASHERPRRRRPRWPYALVLLAAAVLPVVRVLVGGHPGRAVVHFLLILAIVAVVGVGQGYAVYVSSKRTRPRPRQQYFLFCLAYLVLAIVSASIGGAADAHHVGWLSNAMVWPVGLCFAGMVVMFGRGAFRGRVRRAFWRFPPPWLDHDFPAASSATAHDNAHAPAHRDHGATGGGVESCDPERAREPRDDA